MVVRTGGAGASGLSLLMVPLKGYPGVNMRKLETSGQHTTGTTYIELDDVKVPVSNLIGLEGKGMINTMNNFNHERMMLTATILRQARVTLSAAFAYCLKREAFGKKLMDQPVVRHRLAKCGADLESASAWLDGLVYNLSQMPREQANKQLGGTTAMLKAQSTRVLLRCATTSSLLFGGSGFTRTGQGEIAERKCHNWVSRSAYSHEYLQFLGIYREVNGSRVPGGSEDVLLDLGIRQLVKSYNLEAESLKLEKSRM